MNKYQAVLLIFTFMVSPLTALSQDGIHKTIDKLILSGDLDEAERIAKENLDKYPDDPESMCALACVYRNKARKSRVIINTAAMGIKEGESGSYAMKGKEDVDRILQDEIYYDRDSYTKAESLYYKIIETDKNYYNSYFNLLNDYVTMEEFDNYFKVIDLFIDNLKHKTDTPDYLLDLAKKLMEGKYYNEALKLYQKMVIQFPSRLEARSDIGAVYFNKGKINQARDILKEVFEIDKTDIINLKNYILTSVMVEDFNTVFDLYENLNLLNKEEYNHLFDMGLVAIILDKDYEKYLNEFRERRKSEQKQVEKDFWYQHASIIPDILKKDVEEKIGYFEFLSIQFRNSEMYPEALLASNIIEKFKTTNVSLMIQAAVYDRFNFYQKTIEYLDKISDRRKLDESIISEYNLNFNYGRINYTEGKYEDAIAYFLKCFEENKEKANLNYFLGESYLNCKQIDEAKKYFNINKNMNDKEQMEYINYSIRELNKINSTYQ
jgi:tetratricopeptide (TPR) repeat protein